MTSSTATTYAEASLERVAAGNGIDHAYGDVGTVASGGDLGVFQTAVETM